MSFLEDVLLRNYDFAMIVQDGDVTFIDSNNNPELYQQIVDLSNSAPGQPETEPEPIPPVDEINFHWPTDYAGIVTQRFGANPQIYGQWNLPGHEGIDMKAPMNTDIKAVWGGVVTRVDKDVQHTHYGWHIRTEVEINGVMYEMTYAHFSQPSPLNVGDKVQRGNLIGLSGSTGNSTGAHLHFMLKQHKDGDLAKASSAKGWPTAKNDFTIIDSTEFFPELR